MDILPHTMARARVIHSFFATMPMTGSATVGSGPNGEFKIDVKASTDFEYDYTFVDTTPTGKGCFDVNLPYMADRFREYGRCVVVCDARVYDIYGESMRTYYQHHGMGPHEISQSHRAHRIRIPVTILFDL